MNSKRKATEQPLDQQQPAAKQPKTDLDYDSPTLPDEMLCAILADVPPPFIYACRLVCRHWGHDLLSFDPFSARCRRAIQRHSPEYIFFVCAHELSRAPERIHPFLDWLLRSHRLSGRRTPRLASASDGSDHARLLEGLVSSFAAAPDPAHRMDLFVTLQTHQPGLFSFAGCYLFREMIPIFATAPPAFLVGLLRHWPVDRESVSIIVPVFEGLVRSMPGPEAIAYAEELLRLVRDNEGLWLYIRRALFNNPYVIGASLSAPDCEADGAVNPLSAFSWLRTARDEHKLSIGPSRVVAALRLSILKALHAEGFEMPWRRIFTEAFIHCRVDILCWLETACPEILTSIADLMDDTYTTQVCDTESRRALADWLIGHNVDFDVCSLGLPSGPPGFLELVRHLIEDRGVLFSCRLLRDILSERSQWPERMRLCEWLLRHPKCPDISDGDIAWVLVCGGDVADIEWGVKVGIPFPARRSFEASLEVVAPERRRACMEYLISDLGCVPGHKIFVDCAQLDSLDDFLFLSERFPSIKPPLQEMANAAAESGSLKMIKHMVEEMGCGASFVAPDALDYVISMRTMHFILRTCDFRYICVYWFSLLLTLSLPVSTQAQKAREDRGAHPLGWIGGSQPNTETPLTRPRTPSNGRSGTGCAKNAPATDAM
jgi:hypothetical protein